MNLYEHVYSCVLTHAHAFFYACMFVCAYVFMLLIHVHVFCTHICLYVLVHGAWVCLYLCIYTSTQASVLFQISNLNCSFDADQNSHADVNLLSGTLTKS